MNQFNLFGEKLLYQSSESGLNSSYPLQYNGNIAAMVWNSTGKTKQGYGFTYDGLNRLTLDDYKYYSGGWNDHSKYEEKNLTYDKNGNLTRLTRTDSNGYTAEDFNYNYKGNQLSYISSGSAYSYDQNGNTTFDGVRGMTIGYNILNLPKSITKGTDNIAYIYTATGEKLAKKMVANTYQYYAGNMVYNNAKALNYILFDEGKVNKSGSLFVYEYHLKDHLGNTRVAFQPNGSATTPLQVAEYYPFGSNYTPLSPDNSNKYLYNGKEKQSDVLSSTNLDWYDYGVRFYDPQVPRFTTIDPLSENYYDLSSYTYCANNPIKFLDPDGNKIVDANGKQITYSTKNGWSNNVTNSVKVIHSALMQTETGANQWKKAYNSDNKIEMNIVDSKIENKGEEVLGVCEVRIGPDENGKEIVRKEMKIEISLPKIKETLEKGKNEGLTLRQAIGATAGHEIEHTTKSNNDIKIFNRMFPFAKKDVERKPEEVGSQIRKESMKANNQLNPIVPEVRIDGDFR